MAHAKTRSIWDPQIVRTAVWDALRNLRSRLAREQGVPAYVIFHDATLLAMLRERPQTLSALGAISGVGERKLERYGEAFLSELVSPANA